MGLNLASCNSIVIYVPSRANRCVRGIGIQHRPGMRNRNLFSFPFPFPLSATQIFYYFPVEPVLSPAPASCPLPLRRSPPLVYLSLSPPLVPAFRSPSLSRRRKKLLAVMSSCTGRVIVVTASLMSALQPRRFESVTRRAFGNENFVQPANEACHPVCVEQPSRIGRRDTKTAASASEIRNTAALSAARRWLCQV